MIFRKRLGAAIRRNREALHLSGQDLADALALGKPSSVIYGYETGRRPISPDALYLLAKRLGVPVHELVQEASEDQRHRLDSVRHYLRILRRFAAAGELFLSANPVVGQELTVIESHLKNLKRHRRAE